MRAYAILGAALAGSVLLASPPAAQDDPHAACAAVGWVPREVLERPVGLRAGVGRIHDPATTRPGGAKKAPAC